jgi:hypothetical protein
VALGGIGLGAAIPDESDIVAPCNLDIWGRRLLLFCTLNKRGPSPGTLNETAHILNANKVHIISLGRRDCMPDPY